GRGGVGRGLAAVVAVAERPVGVERPAAVGGVGLVFSRELFRCGVRVVRQDAGRRAVEHGDRPALGDGGAVVAGGRGVVDRRDREIGSAWGRESGVGRAVRRAVVTGLVGEGRGRGLCAGVGVAGR